MRRCFEREFTIQGAEHVDDSRQLLESSARKRETECA
jgi:hypothetical protein